LKNAKRKSHITHLLGMACSVTLFAGCTQGDSFNDVIPKMLNGGQTPLNAAGDVFDPTSSDRRREAIGYLNNHKWGHEAAYMKAYNMLATDPDPLVKAQAMRALGDSGNPEVAAVLVKGLDDASEFVRQDASAAAQKITSDKLIDPLIYHMNKDTDSQTRVNCTQALDRYASPKVLMALAAALDDKDAAVVYWAWDHLTKVTGQTYLPKEPKPWQDWLAQRYPQAATENKGAS
jgi:hypothetical protein